MSLIRVFEIPARLPSNFHFSGGEPTTFVEVDWFRDDTGRGTLPEAELVAFIKGKQYYDANKAFLVLHQTHSFTIGYSAP